MKTRGMRLPPWAEHRTYLSAAQLALILGFVGSEGQFDEDAARRYARHFGTTRIKELRERDATFPAPEFPHGEEGRAYWLTSAVVRWIRRKERVGVAEGPSEREASPAQPVAFPSARAGREASDGPSATPLEAA